MAEVLGAVAAAAQLTASCLALVDFLKKVKNSSSILQDYQTQLLQLKDIAKSISTNSLLQTPDIELHTRDIASLLSDQVEKLSAKSSRLSQLVLFLSQDQVIKELLAIVAPSNNGVASCSPSGI